ncbi:hypothetical protein HPB52_015680 [Rhipicephalus sanguineus]|uniref:Retrotransposon gag domain-containing protein n=1 Tax=Rhipicephalus sanguineus TaxID=34632 RepID=A0A9D4PL55_RHISA|nr:hypothetical protein HPB52_015680 [Rhipicephalus sanguineus]
MGPYLQHARWKQGEENTRALPMRVTSGSGGKPQGAPRAFWWAAGRWDAATVALGATVSSVSAAEQRPRRFWTSANRSRWLVFYCELRVPFDHQSAGTVRSGLLALLYTLCRVLPVWKADKKSVTDFLQDLQDYRDAQALPNETLLLRVLPVALSGSAARWRRRQSFESWSHFEQLFRAEFLPPDYAVRMKDELRSRTQAEEESLQEYIRSLQELYDRADPSAPEAERVARAVKQSHPRFQAYLRGRSFSSLDVLATAAVDIQAAMLAELTYQPPPPPESTLEPSCAWHGRSNPMAPPMTPPRALDPFSHHNLPAPSAIPVNYPGTWDTHTGRLDPRPALPEAQVGTLRYASSVEVGATIGASAQADHVLAAGETIGAGDGERMPIAGQHSTAPRGPLTLRRSWKNYCGSSVGYDASSRAASHAAEARPPAAAAESHRGREDGWRIRREARQAPGLFGGRQDDGMRRRAAEQRPRRFWTSANRSRWLVFYCELRVPFDRQSAGTVRSGLLALLYTLCRVLPVWKAGGDSFES